MSNQDCPLGGKCKLPDFWETWEKDLKGLFLQVSETHRVVINLETYLRHLNHLEDIAIQLDSLNKNLVEPATRAAKGVPAWVMVAFGLFLTAIIAMQMLKDSDKSARFSASGFELLDHNANNTPKQ